MSSRSSNLKLRAIIIQSIRSFFVSRGFLEVETPLRIPANAPEEHIYPFRSGEMYLNTSPELCMKRLLSRGHGRIFQVCHCWRSDERGRRHIPEFTMLEWYRADSDYEDLMQDCEHLLQHVAESCISTNSICYDGITIVMDESFIRLTVRDAFAEYSDRSMDDAVRDGSFDEILVTKIEPSLIREKPVLLVDYPIEMAALARPKPGDRSVAERFELYAGGMELANGFSELNDPIEQRFRFLEANRKRISNGLPPLPIPEPFLKELASMPPSAGIALGVDRLVMLFTGATRIDDVIAFTPEEL
ncbi:MAG: EF-P lysine aminoacylase GenX [Geobacteraceae bacterium]|nr:EF-P lysine aminoacylase GenX [Geobacteraceae bacterium]